MAIIYFLNMCPQQSLDILFRIFSDLLKFVDGNNTGFIGFGKINENFIQRIFGSVDIP